MKSILQNESLARCRLIFNNSARNSCTHDVAVAYRLAKAEVRVQNRNVALALKTFIDNLDRNSGTSVMNDYQRVETLGPSSR